MASPHDRAPQSCSFEAEKSTARHAHRSRSKQAYRPCTGEMAKRRRTKSQPGSPQRPLHADQTNSGNQSALEPERRAPLRHAQLQPSQRGNAEAQTSTKRTPVTQHSTAILVHSPIGSAASIMLSRLQHDIRPCKILSFLDPLNGRPWVAPGAHRRIKCGSSHERIGGAARGRNSEPVTEVADGQNICRQGRCPMHELTDAPGWVRSRSRPMACGAHARCAWRHIDLERTP